jgi:hypothetical protein
MAKGGFIEEEHPRGDDGKFKEKSDSAEIRKLYEGTDQWMKAPNGEPTKLTERQWLQVRTPNFKKWFGDWENDPENSSKIVDENGEPKVVYHGTAKKFDEFDPARKGQRDPGDYGLGFYFAERSMADMYRKYNSGQRGRGQLMPVFLSIKQPFDISKDMTMPIAKMIVERANNKRIHSGREPLSDIPDRILHLMNEYNSAEDTWTKHRLKERYDALSNYIRNNGLEELGYDGILGEFEYVAFSPIQIKSATENDGTFGLENHSIKKSLTYSGFPLQGRTKVHGMDISIENKKGSTRSGTDKDGKPWSQKMGWDYGYIRGTVGKDKDHLDVFVGPNPESEKVFVIHQVDPFADGHPFDEDKVMLGWDNANDARIAYLEQYNRPDFFGGIEAMDIETFKEKAFDPKNKGKKLRG